MVDKGWLKSSVTKNWSRFHHTLTFLHCHFDQNLLAALTFFVPSFSQLNAQRNQRVIPSLVGLFVPRLQTCKSLKSPATLTEPVFHKLFNWLCSVQLSI
jgi:hypothetical protein